MRWVLAAIVCSLALAASTEATTTSSSIPEASTSSSSTTSTSTTAAAETTTTATVATSPPTTAPAPGGCVPDGCDDGNPCTLDGCDPASAACMHAPLDGPPCADDGVACTEDRCARGVCEHPPRDVRCDRGQCAVRACRPGDPRADGEGCILVPDQSGTDGSSCTDDGSSCTEDVCMDGTCLHMPVDSACVPPDACQLAACAPARAGDDGTGCVPGPTRADGETCAEDGDPCTVDVCRAGICAHQPETDTAGCAPVQGAFHETIALGTLTEELGATLSNVGSPAVQGPLDRLGRIQSDLESAAAALAGRPAVGPALAAAETGASGSTAAERAHIAFTLVLRTPHQVSTFLQTLALARTRAAIGRPATHVLRRRGRVLLRGTRRLRATLWSLAR